MIVFGEAIDLGRSVLIWAATAILATHCFIGLRAPEWRRRPIRRRKGTHRA